MKMISKWFGFVMTADQVFSSTLMPWIIER